MLRLCAVSLVPIVLVLADGCWWPHSCTLIGAENGVVVDVSVTGTALPPDTYTIVAQADGAEIREDNVILDRGSGQSSPPADVVVQGKHLYLDATLFPDHGWIRVGYREDGQQPAMITVEIRRGAAVLARQSYTPTYKEFQPNGEGCEPTVLVADETLVIAAP
jgi:hypothetical protein